MRESRERQQNRAADRLVDAVDDLLAALGNVRTARDAFEAVFADETAAPTEATPLPAKLLLDPAEAAEALGVGLRTLQVWQSNGEIPFVRLSPRCVKFSRTALEKWIAEQELRSRPTLADVG